MVAEIISVGTELLLGSILNTNAQFLATELQKNSIDLYRQVTIGDNKERLKKAFEEASRRAELVIVSGGLGPTEDDITAQSLAEFAGVPLEFHKPTLRAIKARFTKRHLPFSKLTERQCFLPKGSVVFQNENGTAPAILLKVKGVYFLLLPGPPRELQPIFTKQALPYLLKQIKRPASSLLVRSIRFAGLFETQVATKVADLLKLKPPTTVGIYAKPGEVELKIMCKASSPAQALKSLNAIERTIRSRFKKEIYGIDSESLESAAGKLLKKKRATLAVAESCTGGLVGHLLTQVPGSSDYFVGGILAYDNRIKKDILGVPGELLKKFGAVSPEVAKSMAAQVRKNFKTDYGIGITGIAGPNGGTQRKPVGLVYIAVATPVETTVMQHFFLGKRSDIKAASALHALNALRLKLS